MTWGTTVHCYISAVDRDGGETKTKETFHL